MQMSASHRASLSFVDISDVDPALARTIPESLAWEFGALAIATGGPGRLTVAFAEAPADEALARLERATQMTINPVIARNDILQKALASAFGRTMPRLRYADDAPAISAVDALHERAFFERCSDIHLESRTGETRVRFRTDGLLREVARFGEPLAGPIVSRIKLLAGIDIADRRQPHDGRYTVTVAGRRLDARVSSVPMFDGESVVVRLLDHQVQLPALKELGFQAAMGETFEALLGLSCGFVIVSGPTGSGKTTTLYAALERLNTPDRAICTVEDPVERAIAGIVQVQVNAKASLTFASVLRAHLRQDPDVILVGEMRDAETADTAISAALSGQLVLATIHSGDAPRTVDRLAELGADRRSIAAGLTAAVGQRLVRRLCAHCKVPGSIAAVEARRYGLDGTAEYFEPAGCERCAGAGYLGRIGIFELIVLDDLMREAIAGGAASGRLATLAASRGYRSLRHDCLDKVRSGITSFAEFARVAAGAGLA
jgi:type II secretory ATPase GspE/PulE/Tfp pilus assembly ATPase PilB-like protein